MNANELADKLEQGHWEGGTREQTATMLRQQQAEIESLKVEKIRAYDNGYEDGRKPDTNPKSAKTLTDGIDLLEKYADKLEDERPNKGLSDVVYECVAILRKAQEK